MLVNFYGYDVLVYVGSSIVVGRWDSVVNWFFVVRLKYLFLYGEILINIPSSLSNVVEIPDLMSGHFLWQCICTS